MNPSPDDPLRAAEQYSHPLGIIAAVRYSGSRYSKEDLRWSASRLQCSRAVISSTIGVLE
jgi:hypothetical protein